MCWCGQQIQAVLRKLCVSLQSLRAEGGQWSRAVFRPGKTSVRQLPDNTRPVDILSVIIDHTYHLKYSNFSFRSILIGILEKKTSAIMQLRQLVMFSLVLVILLPRGSECQTFNIFSQLSNIRSGILSILDNTFSPSTSSSSSRPRPPPRPATFNTPPRPRPVISQPPPPPLQPFSQSIPQNSFSQNFGQPQTEFSSSSQFSQNFNEPIFTPNAPQTQFSQNVPDTEFSQNFPPPEFSQNIGPSSGIIVEERPSFTSFSVSSPPSTFQEPQPFPPSTFSENPIVEVVSNTFDNTIESEPLILPPDNRPGLGSGSSLPRPVPVNVGPASFIDSERVNAGSDLDNEIDDNLLAHLPADLWREDIEGIKHEKKIRVTKEINTK